MRVKLALRWTPTGKKETSSAINYLARVTPELREEKHIVQNTIEIDSRGCDWLIRTITAYKRTVVLLSTKCHNLQSQNIGTL